MLGSEKFWCLGLLFMAVGCTGAGRYPTSWRDRSPSYPRPQPLQLGNHLDKESVDFYLNRYATDHAQSLSEQWLVQYLRAQNWAQSKPEVACALYAQLSKDTQFPLAPLAQLRAIDVCPIGYSQMSDEGPIASSGDLPWLAEYANAVALRQAHLKNDREKIMILSFQTAQSAPVKAEKVRLMQDALGLAKDLERRDLVANYRQHLLRLSPSLDPNPKDLLWPAVADDFRERRELSQARRYYRKILRHDGFSPDEKIKAWHGIRTCYKLERERNKYVWATEQLLSFVDRIYKKDPSPPQNEKNSFDTHILLARTYWTEGRVGDAEKILTQLETKLEKKMSMAASYWLRARIAEESGDYLAALGWLERASQAARNDRDLQEKILWTKAWNLRKVSRNEGAAEVLDSLAKQTKSPYNRYQYLFWRAKILGAMGDKSSAERIFERLIQQDSVGYYGLLAHRELKRTLSPTRPQKSWDDVSVLNTVSQNIASSSDGVYLDWLIATNEKVLARQLLDQISQRYQTQADVSLAEWTELFGYYAKAGSYLDLFTQLGRLPAQTREELLAKAPHLLFPRPYESFVNSATNRFGLSSELIYAIMRQESAFNPRARSHADAFGLMQLLPSVAKVSAQKNRIPLRQDDELFEPHINIPIGSAYLSELWEKSNGGLILTVASYNASESAIQSWLATRYRGDSLEFIEDIPYDETRNYVKLVLRNLIFYQRLTASQPLPFPEWCLEIRQE